MTTHSERTKRKLSLLQLAEELGNVSKACQIMGYHRDTFYEVRRARTSTPQSPPKGIGPSSCPFRIIGPNRGSRSRGFSP